MSDIYKHAERLLYTHAKTVSLWHSLLMDYVELKESTDLHGQRYTDLHLSDGQVSDPAGEYVHRLLILEERVRSIEQRVKLIERVRTRLESSHDEDDAVKRLILERYYFGGESMTDLAASLDIHYRTLYRRRRELVKEVVRELEVMRDEQGTA